jgi:hypothetical protein
MGQGNFEREREGEKERGRTRGRGRAREGGREGGEREKQEVGVVTCLLLTSTLLWNRQSMFTSRKISRVRWTRSSDEKLSGSR